MGREAAAKMPLPHVTTASKLQQQKVCAAAGVAKTAAAADSLCFSGDTIFFLIQKLILFLLQNIFFLFLDCFNQLIL